MMQDGMRLHVRRPTAVEVYAACQVGLLAAALGAAAATSTSADWRPVWAAVVLASLAILAIAFLIRLGHLRLSGAFIALVIAMVVLGPAPACAIGILTVVADGLRTRKRGLPLLTDLATYAVFPLADRCSHGCCSANSCMWTPHRS